jgi:phytoene synthase
MTRTHPDHVAASRAIHRRTGKNFYLATRLFPERIRHGTYALYGFFRVADEVVDDPGDDTPQQQRRELARIRAEALGERDSEDPVLTAFRAVADEHEIDDREIELFMDAMEMDVTVGRYETHDDLSTYLRGSSVAVAYMMLDVMGAADRERARPHAKALGEAFQLTNFLRDVREDVLEFDRIYIPLATLEQFDVDPAEIESLSFSERFATAMAYELRRTERLYREGVAGIEYLPRDCQFPVLLAAVLYAEHHRLIRRRDYDVLSARPTLSHSRRLAVAARTWLRWKRSGDPVETFEAVSAVPATDPGSGTGGSSQGGGAGAPEPTEVGLGADEQILADGDPASVGLRRSIRRRLGDLFS